MTPPVTVPTKTVKFPSPPPVTTVVVKVDPATYPLPPAGLVNVRAGPV